MYQLSANSPLRQCDTFASHIAEERATQSVTDPWNSWRLPQRHQQGCVKLGFVVNVWYWQILPISLGVLLQHWDNHTIWPNKPIIQLPRVNETAPKNIGKSGKWISQEMKIYSQQNKLKQNHVHIHQIYWIHTRTKETHAAIPLWIGSHSAH